MRKKGADLLIKAYIEIISNIPKGEVFPKLVIAGPGLETDYGRILQELAINYQDYIFFPGMLAGSAKWGAFYGCEAFVLPTHQENFGIAIVEALACAKPVLISDKTNIWQEVKNGGGGTIATDTFIGTKELLENWFKLPQISKREFAHRARRTYQAHFTMHEMELKWTSSMI